MTYVYELYVYQTLVTCIKVREHLCVPRSKALKTEEHQYIYVGHCSITGFNYHGNHPNRSSSPGVGSVTIAYKFINWSAVKRRCALSCEGDDLPIATCKIL